MELKADSFPSVNKVGNDNIHTVETECTSNEELLLTRIHVPELHISKCLQFSKDQLIWDVKQQCLSSLPKELKESFNYGLFCPPMNGKAGKFLDEERRLGDYSFNGRVGYLELKYKRRIYKVLHLDEKRLKAIHTRTNFRRLIEYVTSNQVEKISKLCCKGLDPNFHCQESGETPLTFATSLQKPSKVIIALVNGSALLDYRTKEGLTAMHRAVERNSIEAVRTLLELGASPNYKDTKGLTPLYYSVIHKTDSILCETLLRDHARIGAQDFQGWQEIHHACRNNLVQHLDHLLFYGADMNARNASGNTPLHICAVNNTDSACTKQLLLRGAQKDSLNYANQTPYQVAVIAGNMELADIIKNYSVDEIDKSYGDATPDNVSEVSGGETTQPEPVKNPLSNPGTTVVCIEPYSSGIAGHLIINQGDVIEVTGATDCGLLEGISSDQGIGLFPAHCVQEVRLRHSHVSLAFQHVKDNCDKINNRREFQCKYFATAPRLKKPVTSEPKTVVLHRSKKGFGFILRGAKSTPSNLTGFTPAAQYLDDVSPGGVADMAGLKKGDFLIQINGEDVTSASHEHVVDMIRRSGELVRMTVVSPLMNLPYSHSSVMLPNNQRQFATLPRKTSNHISTINTLGRSPAPLPPRRDPKTTLSVGRARARSMVAGLENDGDRDEHEDVTSSGGKSSSAESIHLNQQPSTHASTGQNTPVQPRTASIRSRPTSNRITAAELEELFQRQQGNTEKQKKDYSMMNLKFQSELDVKSHPTSPAKNNRIYASIVDMKEKATLRMRLLNGSKDAAELHRDFHSTPNLNVQYQSSDMLPKNYYSHGDVNITMIRNSLPPPDHPPPPPPFGQVVKVQVGASIPDVVAPSVMYDNSAHVEPKQDVNSSTESQYNIMSSFRPFNNAKLYASPEDPKTVGYRSYSLAENMSRALAPKNYGPQLPNNVAGRTSNEMSSKTPLHAANNPNTINDNQYAEPMRINRNRAAGAGGEPSGHDRKNKMAVNNSAYPGHHSGPPIPEPDYSLSESENEEHGDHFNPCGAENNKDVPKIHMHDKMDAANEALDNSNNSGSSSASNNSVPRSFSVEEIQKVRVQLKSSKSHPNELLLSQVNQQLNEDGDNSSSGVSSDQEIPVASVTAFNKFIKTCDDRSIVAENENNYKRMNNNCGILSRQAVSLAQLPPPFESEAEDQANVMFVPPPPEFNADSSLAAANDSSNELVFAPPPQFCDNRQQIEQCHNKIHNEVKPKKRNNQDKLSSDHLLTQ